MTLRTASSRLSLVVFAALGAIVPLLVGDYGAGVLLQLFAWIALTASWAVFSSMTGYLSLGHAVFYGLGGYMMALTWGDWPFLASLLLAAVIASAFAALVGLPALRVRGPYFVILTLGLSEFAKYSITAVESSLGSSGRLLLQTPSVQALCYGMLVLAVVAVGTLAWLDHSRLGHGLRAIREDETAAATLGVPTTRLKLIAFVLSAAIPGMVGALIALRSTYFEAMQMFSPMTSFTVVTMAIVGGGDKPIAPILGATFFALLSELLWARAPSLYLILLGVLLLCFVLFAPDGLAGRLSALMHLRRTNATSATQEEAA